MQGAGKYAIPIFLTYDQLGLEKIRVKEIRDYFYYGNHVAFVFDAHARGRTLDIYLIKNEEELKEKGLFKCDRVKVYGMVSGQAGWTEKYGWILKGSWCKHITDILNNAVALYEQNRKRADELNRQRKIEERNRAENKAKEFEKYFQ